MSILMEPDEGGRCLLDDPARRSLHILTRVDYDSNFLGEREFRDSRRHMSHRGGAQLLSAEAARKAGCYLSEPAIPSVAKDPGWRSDSSLRL